VKNIFRLKNKKRRKNMKTINMLMCLLLITGGIAYAQQGGSNFGPPPEAYAACKAKKAGDSATFVNPKGETITGTCRQAGRKANGTASHSSQGAVRR
jgi:hypothetical protein